ELHDLERGVLRLGRRRGRLHLAARRALDLELVEALHQSVVGDLKARDVLREPFEAPIDGVPIARAPGGGEANQQGNPQTEAIERHLADRTAAKGRGPSSARTAPTARPIPAILDATSGRS